MEKNRLEAFSDGVLAIIITIMVLGLQVPAGPDITVLKPLLPVFLTYALSFIYPGIYWNNHHHLLKASPILYAAAIGMAFFEPWISCSLCVLVALMWLIPDRRIERVLDESGSSPR